MRIALLTGFLLAQAASPSESVRDMVVRSETQRQVGRVLEARGHVHILYRTSEITADEADVTYLADPGPVDIQLRGNVRMFVRLQ